MVRAGVFLSKHHDYNHNYIVIPKIIIVPKSKGKNTQEGEGNVAKGLVDLGINNEKDEKKFLEIVNEEEKHVKGFVQMSTKQILEKECDKLVLVYLHSADVFFRQKKI